MTINEYFDKVIFINLARRTDRLAHCLEELEKHGIEAERFEGIDGKDGLPGVEGKNLGHHGCTGSHRAVLEMIVGNGWEKTLVLEDDVQFRFEDTQERFSEYIKQVPDDWFLLYLSGHYADDPLGWVSHNVIRFNHMKTTTSYGIKLESAKRLIPVTIPPVPIDECLSHFGPEGNCYIFEPRLAFQYASFSDIERLETRNEGCMLDTGHVSRLEGRPLK